VRLTARVRNFTPAVFGSHAEHPAEWVLSFGIETVFMIFVTLFLF